MSGSLVLVFHLTALCPVWIGHSNGDVGDKRPAPVVLEADPGNVPANMGWWLSAFEEHKRKTVRDLIEVAKVEAKPIVVSGGKPVYAHRDRKHMALLLLAEFPDADAIPVLLANLDYHNPRHFAISSYQPLGFYYPAADALVKIGLPAMQPVIDKLGLCMKDGRVRHNCCWILEKHYGRELARSRIEQELKKDLHPTIRANLQAALRLYFTGERGIAPFGREYE